MASILITRGLHSLIASRPNEITKRDSDIAQQTSRGLFLVFVLVNVILFVPLLLFLSYTLGKLYPTLAIVEGDTPPDYELVVGKDIDVDIDDAEIVDTGSDPKDADVVVDDTFDGKASSASAIPDHEPAGVPAMPSQPVTTGLIATLRLLRASGGGIFKAFRWSFLYSVMAGVVFICLSLIPYMPSFVASVIASLAATKFETAWTISAVSSQRDGYLWKKLPSYLTILKATAVPLLGETIFLEAINFVALLPLGKRTGSVDPTGVIPHFSKGNKGVSLVFAMLLYLTLFICLMVPTDVILTRTRVSMISKDAKTLVPLDSLIRSQKVEEMGFMSWTHALRTLSRETWARVVKVYAKVLAITFMAAVVMTGFLITEVLIFSVGAVSFNAS